MRRIDHHKTGSDLNDHVDVYAMDRPDHEKGRGACHDYAIGHVDLRIMKDVRLPAFVTTTQVKFQHGPVKEVGINGASDEALLGVLIDRLEHFQAGPFACEANDVALEHLTGALGALKARTNDRIERGVEGKSEA